MEYIVVMLASLMGSGSPVIIQGFQNVRVCEVAAVEFKRQMRVESTKCIQLPANVVAVEQGLSVDGSRLSGKN